MARAAWLKHAGLSASERKRRFRSMANVYAKSPGTRPEGNVDTKRERVQVRRNYRHIEVRPFAPNLGAEVRGIDLANGLTTDQFDEVF